MILLYVISVLPLVIRFNWVANEIESFISCETPLNSGFKLSSGFSRASSLPSLTHWSSPSVSGAQYTCSHANVQNKLSSVA